jgi:hypothetical protein
MGWTRRAPPQPAASGGVLSSPGLFGVPRPAKYAGLPPLDHPARGHSPDEIRRLAARAASPRCRSSSGNSLCGQNSAGFRESARPFKGIICDDISEFESYHPSHAVGSLWRVYPVHGLCEQLLGQPRSRSTAGAMGPDCTPRSSSSICNRPR